MEDIKSMRGKVRTFDSNRGFGFIVPEKGGKDVFVHYSAIMKLGYKTLDPGDIVEFDIVQTDRGSRAKGVVIL